MRFSMETLSKRRRHPRQLEDAGQASCMLTKDKKITIIVHRACNCFIPKGGVPSLTHFVLHACRIQLTLLSYMPNPVDLIIMHALDCFSF